MDFEEKESTNRDSSIDAGIYFDMCQDIKEMLKEIYERKREKEVDVCRSLLWPYKFLL